MLPGRPMLDFEKLKKKIMGGVKAIFEKQKKKLPTYSPSFVISSYYYYYTLY